jgi:serralysin
VTSHQSEQDHVTVAASHNGYFAFALDDAFSNFIDPWFRTYQTPLVPPSAPPFFAIGGAPGRVQVRRQADGALVGTFAPYPNYTGPISVTLADVTGDGAADLITGALTGNPDVRVFNGAAFANGTFDLTKPNNSLVAQWFPYALQFNVGANVTAGDVNDDGFADVITGASVGNPDVIVFSGKDIAQGAFDPAGTSQLAHFFAYGLGFNIGANVGAGDIDKDGFADVVTAPTAGNPDIHVYSGKDIAQGPFDPTGASLIAQWFAYGINFNVGAFVSVADMNGDGFRDVVTGASTGNPQVNVYSGATIANGTFDPVNSLLAVFYAFDVGQNIGVTVGAVNGEIYTGSTRTGQYRLVAGLSTGVKPPVLRGIEGFANDVIGGVFIGT